MARLFHYPLDPFSRRVRLMLGEYGAFAELVEERFWEGRHGFLALNPAGQVPVMVDDDGTVAAGIEAVSGHVEETRAADDETSLAGASLAERAEVRRLVAWFDGKFHHEVGLPVLTEKVVRRFLARDAGGGPPDMNRVRHGLAGLRGHLDYIAALVEDRNWLAGDRLTLADLAAASHVSVLDYLGDVPWSASEAAKAWYQRIKSRPAFRPLLADMVRGMPPPRSYADLDF